MTSESERASRLEVARAIALELLSVRQRSTHELRTALAKRNVPVDVAEEILARFAEVGLVDDAAFAVALTASRSGFALRGRHRIRQELQARGIDRELADAALARLQPEDEYAAALALAQRRARAMAGLEPLVARRRLMGVLARRGFPGAVVAAVTDQVLGELADTEDDSTVEFSTGQE